MKWKHMTRRKCCYGHGRKTPGGGNTHAKAVPIESLVLSRKKGDQQDRRREPHHLGLVSLAKTWGFILGGLGVPEGPTLCRTPGLMSAQVSIGRRNRPVVYLRKSQSC